MEAVAPLANDPIMLGRPIQSFRDLEHQNLSIISDSLVPILATREAVALLANDLIMSGTLIELFRHLEHQNLSIISEDIGRASWMQNL